MCYSPSNLPKKKTRHEATLSLIFISDLKQTKQATAMKKATKKGINKQDNFCACAF